MKLDAGQVAVITGGASGIGNATARALAARGLRIVLADVEPAALEAAATALRAQGTEVLAAAVDVRRPEQLEALAAQTIQRFGRVDLVMNNAGVVTPLRPMWEVPANDWSWVLEVNLRGVINGISAFVPHLVAQGHGHVVNTSSMAGLLALPYLGPYVAAKHAVMGLSESLRVELDLHAPAVGVTVVCPGLVATNLHSADRNRPADLTGADAAVASELLADPAAGGGRSVPVVVDVDEVAAAIVAAVEADRLHLVTHPGSNGAIRDRVQRVLDDLNPATD